MIPITALVFRIPVEGIERHQTLVQAVVRRRIIRIRAVGNFNRIVHAVSIGISLIRIRSAGNLPAVAQPISVLIRCRIQHYVDCSLNRQS